MPHDFGFALCSPRMFATTSMPCPFKSNFSETNHKNSIISSQIMLQQIKQTAEWIQSRLSSTPRIALILGSGLGNLGKEIQAEQTIPYSEIPNFPVSTVEGHACCLIIGKLGDKDILAMNGRFHYYEGYSMKEVTFPIRVFFAL